MSHYYDEWNKIVEASEIIEEIEERKDWVKRIIKMITDVEEDLKKGLNEYTTRLLNNDLSNLQISLNHANESVKISERLFDDYKKGKKVTGYMLGIKRY